MDDLDQQFTSFGGTTNGFHSLERLSSLRVVGHRLGGLEGVNRSLSESDLDMAFDFLTMGCLAIIGKQSCAGNWMVQLFAQYWICRSWHLCVKYTCKERSNQEKSSFQWCWNFAAMAMTLIAVADSAGEY